MVFPFFLELSGTAFLEVNYLMLLRLFKIKKMLTDIADVVCFKEKNRGIFELSCLIYYIVIVSHFCACVFCKIADIESNYYNYGHTWLDA